MPWCRHQSNAASLWQNWNVVRLCCTGRWSRRPPRKLSASNLSEVRLGNQRIPVREKMPESSSTVLSTLSPYLIGFNNNAHTHPFNGPLSGTTPGVSRYQKGKTDLDFTEARDSEWQWHKLGQMQICTSLQTGNHARTPPLSFLQAGCPSYRPTNSIKTLTELQ